MSAERGTTEQEWLQRLKESARERIAWNWWLHYGIVGSEFAVIFLIVSLVAGETADHSLLIRLCFLFLILTLCRRWSTPRAG